MQVISFGDSFTFGSDLPDALPVDPITGDPARPTFSNLTWPALVAKNLGYPYSSFAFPGKGNKYIANTAIDAIAQYTNTALYIVNWTWIDRYDYIDLHEPVVDGWEDKKTLRPVDTASDSRANYYFKHLHSQLDDKQQNLMWITSVLHLLQTHKCQFIMTSLDPDLLSDEFFQTPGIDCMQQYITQHLTWFDNQSFYTWAKSNNYAISPTMHPLEQAHNDAANIVLAEFNNSLTTH